jgi:hypothetical protein
MKFKRHGNYVRINDEMTFPLPLSDSEWESLMLENPPKEIISRLMSINGAYDNLINRTIKSRNPIITALRTSIFERTKDK